MCVKSRVSTPDRPQNVAGFQNFNLRKQNVNQDSKSKAYWNMLRVVEPIQVWCHQQPTPRSMTPLQRVTSLPPLQPGESRTEIIDGRKYRVIQLPNWPRK